MLPTPLRRPTAPLTALLLALALALVAFAAGAPAAQAAYAVDVADASPSDSDDAGAFSSFSLSIGFPQDSTPKSLAIELPKGQLGVLNAVGTCTFVQFTGDTCADSTKLGGVSVKVKTNVIGTITAPGSIYRIPATGTELARIGVVVRPPMGDKMFLQGTLRLRSDYGIVAALDDIPKTANLTIIPGFPPSQIDVTIESMLMTMYGRVGNAGSNGFFFNPSECTAATTNVSSIAYDGSSASDTFSYTPVNCAGAPFAPTLAFTPTSSASATPTAVTVDVGQPFSATAAKVPSPFRTAQVVLPAGVQLTGSSNSDGQLAVCSDVQFDFATLGPASCPAGAKVGTVILDSPLVGAIPGEVFLAQPASSGDLLRLFIVAQLGTQQDILRVKLLGRVAVDPSTGLVTTTLANLPAQPVRSLKLTFRAGTAPALRQPRTCGTYSGSASLTPYSSATPAARTASYVVDQNCGTAGRFRPTIGMAMTPTTAGANSTGATTIDLPIGDEALTNVKVSLPPGLLATIKGVPRCSAAQVQADTCAVGSQVGTVRSLAGQSTSPGTFNGTVSLTDAPASAPGAIAGLFIRVPVAVGPIVVDTLKIQASIVLRPDYGLDVISTIPDNVRGLQLDQQQLRLVFDRANFMVNPPLCTGNTVSGRYGSAQGTTVTSTSTIAVTGCSALLFDPAVTFTASPPSATAASSLTTTVTFPDSTSGAIQSPAKRFAVTLPDGVSLSASADAAGDLAGCTDVQFAAATFSDPTCPAGSNVGTTAIDTPTVGRLSGAVYLAATAPGHLARIFVDAKSDDFGASARVKLEGTLDVDEATGRTTATFDGLPPVNFTSFSLVMRGGAKPVLAMPRNCGTTTGSAVATPHSGSLKTISGSLTIAQDCPSTPAPFSPTIALSRSSTKAGEAMTFGTTVTVPAGQQELRSLALSLPAGLLGKISSIPACTRAAAEAGTCTVASKVGLVSAQVGVASAPFTVTGSAYLVQGDANVIARLALVLPAKVGPIDLGDVITFADLKLRGDYGLDVSAASIPTRVKGVRLDLQRFTLSIDKPGFMVNPLTCADATAASTIGAAQGGSVQRTSTLTTDGCDALALDASLTYGADPASPATASSVTTSIRASAPSGSPLDAMKAVSVAMPEGVSLSPSAGARGDLDECLPAQFAAADITVDAACPVGSKVGTVHLASPMVGNLTGDVFLGAKAGSHFSGVYFQATAPEYPSLRVKIAGTLDVDETTGRLAATFDDLPQVQVSAIDLTLRGGDAPVLSLPRTCGDFASVATIARHGGANSTATGKLSLFADCPDPAVFSPSLSLGLSNTQAAGNTTLSTVIAVPARQQELSALSVAMPAGLLGRLTVVPPCPRAAAQQGACGEESLVGTVTAKVGVASAPFTVHGKAYMTAGTDDAIAGLAFMLPAKVGPIDLGMVVTLAKLKLEGNDLQLKIVADAVPTRVKGVPLTIGELAIEIDKPGLVLNASTCGPQAARASFVSAQGNAASSSAEYTASGCDRLTWKPAMDLVFSGSAKDLTTKGHPTITTVIEQQEGQGNLRAADVLLPPAASTDLANINPNLCESAAASAAGACPDRSKVGTAEIITSALPEPVDAAIHIVRLPGQPLPGLAIHVRDQIAFDVVGQTKISPSGRIQVKFDGLPDTPISKMTLVFAGGPKGVIQLSRDVCADLGNTDGVLTAQHGATQIVELAANCNGKVANPLSGRGSASAGGATSKLSVRPTGKRKGYSLGVDNTTGIRRVTFTMPKGFSYTKQARNGVTVKLTGAGNAKVKVRRIFKGRTLTVKVSSDKVTRVLIVAKPKAVKFTAKYAKSLRKKAGQKKLKPKLTILDATAKPLTPLGTVVVKKK